MPSLGDILSAAATGKNQQDVTDAYNLKGAQVQDVLAQVPLRGAQTQEALQNAQKVRLEAIAAQKKQDAIDKFAENEIANDRDPQQSQTLGHIIAAGGNYEQGAAGMGHLQEQDLVSQISSPTSTPQAQILASQGLTHKVENPYVALPPNAVDLRNLAPPGAPPNELISQTGQANIDAKNASTEKIKNTASGQYSEARAQGIAAGKMAFPTSYEFTRNGPEAEALINRVFEISPNASAQDLPTQMQALNAFNKGVPGQRVTALNTAMNHLDTIKDLGAALKNGDTTAFNAVAQFFAQQTGDPAPTNMDEAAEIVGNEIMKSIVASGAGTGPEREKLAESFSKARSPAQINDAIKTARSLLSGQAASLALQYKNGTKRDDFYDRNPVLRGLTGGATSGTPNKSATPAAAPATALPAGPPPPAAALAGLAEGMQRHFKDGSTWTIQSGKPVRVK